MKFKKILLCSIALMLAGCSSGQSSQTSTVAIVAPTNADIAAVPQLDQFGNEIL
jgi:uncharacterized lipoprotein YajG